MRRSAGVRDTAEVNVTVTAVADIVGDSVTATEDVPLVISQASLLANDTFEGLTPVVSSVGTATHGTVSLSGGTSRTRRMRTTTEPTASRTR